MNNAYDCATMIIIADGIASRLGLDNVTVVFVFAIVCCFAASSNANAVPRCMISSENNARPANNPHAHAVDAVISFSFSQHQRISNDLIEFASFIPTCFHALLSFT